MNRADVLEKAAKVIEQRGWQQDDLGYLDHGPVCALGAIHAVVGARRMDVHGRKARLIDGAREAVERHVGGVAIGTWNDVASRTKRQVLATLRKAAADLRRGSNPSDHPEGKCSSK
jgi:hypothetical protein